MNNTQFNYSAQLHAYILQQNKNMSIKYLYLKKDNSPFITER